MKSTDFNNKNLPYSLCFFFTIAKKVKNTFLKYHNKINTKIKLISLIMCSVNGMLE